MTVLDFMLEMADLTKNQLQFTAYITINQMEYQVWGALQFKFDAVTKFKSVCTLKVKLIPHGVGEYAGDEFEAIAFQNVYDIDFRIEGNDHGSNFASTGTLEQVKIQSKSEPVIHAVEPTSCTITLVDNV